MGDDRMCGHAAPILKDPNRGNAIGPENRTGSNTVHNAHLDSLIGLLIRWENEADLTSYVDCSEQSHLERLPQRNAE